MAKLYILLVTHLNLFFILSSSSCCSFCVWMCCFLNGHTLKTDWGHFSLRVRKLSWSWNLLFLPSHCTAALSSGRPECCVLWYLYFHSVCEVHMLLFLYIEQCDFIHLQFCPTTFLVQEEAYLMLPKHLLLWFFSDVRVHLSNSDSFVKQLFYRV